MARNKDRGTPEVNSGSMADIAFLLLIFFLVTTTIANDKGIALQLPPPPEPDQEIIEFKERNLFKILANSQNQLLVENEPFKGSMTELKEQVKTFVLNFEKPTPEMAEVYNSFPSSMKAKVKRDENSSDHPGKAIVSFKANRGTDYKLYLEVLDALQSAYNDIYGERVGLTGQEFLNLDKTNPVEKKLYDKGREGIPRALSIAEPEK